MIKVMRLAYISFQISIYVFPKSAGEYGDNHKVGIVPRIPSPRSQSPADGNKQQSDDYYCHLISGEISAFSERELVLHHTIMITI